MQPPKFFGRTEQSSQGIVVGTAAVKEVRTNAVKGMLSAEQALSQMLAGTGLVATRDEKNGAFAVPTGGL